MQALRKEKQGPGHVQMTDVPIPKAGPDQVQIAVQAAGICGTDVHIYHDTFPYVPPVILGHEFSGQVTAVGD
ncbi:MAG: alcohol dehydrogenase catalytic domain-containing protein, partial [Planctomycetota bacterium]|nr:alcohol dehydrogenase catalytic domain-containing protein [Planctomycetota bacterium]